MHNLICKNRFWCCSRLIAFHGWGLASTFSICNRLDNQLLITKTELKKCKNKRGNKPHVIASLTRKASIQLMLRCYWTKLYQVRNSTIYCYCDFFEIIRGMSNRRSSTLAGCNWAAMGCYIQHFLNITVFLILLLFLFSVRIWSRDSTDYFSAKPRKIGLVDTKKVKLYY